MTSNHLTAIFEEEPPGKKKYTRWGTASIAFLLLVQLLILAVCTIALIDAPKYSDELSYFGNGYNNGFIKMWNILIEGKLLLAIFGLAAPFLSFYIRKRTGWILVAAIYYVLLVLGVVCMFKMLSQRVTSTWPVVFFIGTGLLAVSLFNQKPAKSFYQVAHGQKMLWWNMTALLMGVCAAIFLLYNFHGQ